MSYQKGFLVGLLCMWGVLANAQQLRKLAYEHINNLHEGTLIVCLPVSKSELGYLNKRLAMPTISDKERAIITARITDTKAQNVRSGELLRKTFEQYYTFSAFRFMDDSCLVGLDVEVFRRCSGVETGPIYLLQFERISETGLVSHGLIVKDTRLKHLYSPFPFFTKTLFADEIYELSLGKAVRKLNKRLGGFYKKSLKTKN